MQNLYDNHDEAAERAFDQEERQIVSERFDEEAIENRLAALRQQEFIIGALAPFFAVKGGR